MSEPGAGDPRVTIRRGGPADPDGQVVLYWMQRAQRAWDNPALDAAIDLANRLNLPVVVFFGLHSGVQRANLRHYQFLVEGLPDLAEGLRTRRVGFILRRPPDHGLFTLVEELRPAIVIGDENPLRQFAGWRAVAERRLRVPFRTVDADVVVPSALVRDEQYAARTMRPRVHAHLERFLAGADEPVARVRWRMPRGVQTFAPTADLLEGLSIDRSVPPGSLRGGLSEARRHLAVFLRDRLEAYGSARGHPELDGTSELSPYLHFGQIGPREIARAVRSKRRTPGAEAFIEQLVVRRELAVNFVRCNPQYDRLEGCERWALRDLDRHRDDPRAHVYSEARLEAADTHDPLWNAAQIQMMRTGWMHGYMRMYWAKKILEWTRSPADAFQLAVRLNDRYELDGRDPNGYAGIAWAICGKHDRPWPRREVWGTIRPMTFASTRRKFDAAGYIERWKL